MTIKELIDKLNEIEDKERYVVYRTYFGNIFPINEVTIAKEVEDFEKNIFKNVVILERFLP